MQLKKRKIVKFGTSFAMLIPKAYVDDGNLELGKEYDIVVQSPKEAFYGVLPLNLA